jgi:DNA-binding NarL/FixJ family response regulator
MLRIALADDQALIRHGLKALLETLGGIEVVVQAADGDSLLDALASAQPETLKQVLEAAIRGQRIFQPGPAIRGGTPAANLTAIGLTEQEAAILLRLVAGGYSNKEIARHLHISMGTVKNHISDILRKLDARDRTHAVLKAIAGHFLSKEDSVTD